ncbi:MAG: hypothetical protein WD072_09135 [Pirellulales bacterium]
MYAWSLLRRLTAWTMLVLYGLVASGLPLPLPSRPADANATEKLADKDRSRPFPCMDKPCGCATAEQCFTNCCCHTPAERLAWAKARGLEPVVLAALARRVAVVAVAAAEPGLPPVGSCCSATPKIPSRCELALACCQEEDTSTISSAAEHADEPQPVTDDELPRGAAGTVILRAMLACGGLANGLLAAAVGGSLPPPQVEFISLEGLRQEIACRDESPLRLPAEPAERPPRGG